MAGVWFCVRKRVRKWNRPAITRRTVIIIIILDPISPIYKQALSWQEPGPANNEKKLQESDEMEEE